MVKLELLRVFKRAGLTLFTLFCFLSFCSFCLLIWSIRVTRKGKSSQVTYHQLYVEDCAKSGGTSKTGVDHSCGMDIVPSDLKAGWFY
jgi:hypothetical protein